MHKLQEHPGIHTVLTKADAAAAFSLPADRIGDLVVVSDVHKVLGLSPEAHDLTQLKEPLRSHGGLSEQNIPFLCTSALPIPGPASPFNYDVLHIMLNAEH